MKLNKSPLAPSGFPTLPRIDGVSLFVGQAGVKYKDRNDVTLMALGAGSTIAGVFTKSSAPGAPIDWSRSVLNAYNADKPIGILVNTGNANVFTGAAGAETVNATAKSAAKLLRTPKTSIFVASTGVIGEPLDPAPICETLDSGGLQSCSWETAADAIRTTDTFAKGAGRTIVIDGQTVNIAGIVKGSGMIAPDMATMLGFVFTDAAIDANLLQNWHSEICEQTFNAITVDSDTSTSDMVLLAAAGRCGVKISKDTDAGAGDIKSAIADVMRELAQLVVKDGEGASKFITIKIEGALTDADAKTFAMSIANSPLVKTAIAGEDANWGRIVMAIGKSGAKADRDALSIHFGPHCVARNGVRAPSYDEAILSAYMKSETIEITVDIGLGDAAFTAWTCDLTHGYIDINADYRS